MYKIFLIVYGYIFLQMFIVWLIYLFSNNPSIVDVAWPVGLMVSGEIYLFSESFISWRDIIISLLLLLWAIRLASYLWLSRVRKGLIDKRYTDLSNSWEINKSVGYFFNYQLQGLFILIISVVFFFISKIILPSFIDIILYIFICVSIIGEAISDRQLQKFKETNAGGVCNIGFWNYSRHPNYFFDWLTWSGFACLGLAAPYGFVGLISPLVLYIIFTKITGPMTEQGSIKARGQKYINYQKETSMFFPWFKNKSNAI